MCTDTPSQASITSILSGCFDDGSIRVTLSASQCVNEDLTGFMFNCSGSTCFSDRVDCSAAGDELIVTFGSRSGSHEVDVYAMNRCGMIGDPVTTSINVPLGGKLQL